MIRRVKERGSEIGHACHKHIGASSPELFFPVRVVSET